MEQTGRKELSDSSDRRAGEIVLFATAFVGFGMAVAGIILTSPPLAVIGGLGLLLAISRFRAAPED